LITLGSRLFDSSVPPASALFSILLVVVVVALVGGWRPALLAVVIGLLAQEVLFTFPYGSLNNHEPAQLSVLVAFVIIGAGVGILVDELARLTEEQAALRRIAMLVATEAPIDTLFTAVTGEVGRLLRVDFVGLGRFGPEGTMTAVAGGNVETLAAQDGVSTEVPVTVEGRPWGMMIVASTGGRPLPANTEARLAGFTDLLATAIANAESRANLAASRARIVATADETRRRIERDLHDGAQQRLVSLALDLRAAQAAVPPELGELEGELSRAAEGLVSALDELREFARGIHPAILADGGLGPALRVLARRSPVPVDLDLRAEPRLPERVEVATYYVVSETLANAAKHAHASVVHVGVEVVDHAVRVSVRDDGAGGADPTQGSGLVGLKDRVEALDGTITISSAPGEGTSVHVELPVTV
jgi:signal transduction histidine kinase